MSKVQEVIDFAIGIANNNSHGYSQENRSGKPDYDCSSLVIESWEQAGVKVKEAGATYTGNMKNVFLKCGFVNVFWTVGLTSCRGMLPGDILLSEGHHTAIYIGNEQIVHASINEFGKIVGGKPGDQTGKEICIRSYYNHPWNCVLRYTGSSMTFEEAIEFLSPKAALSKEYWIARKGIDPYFEDLMIKIATSWKNE